MNKCLIVRIAEGLGNQLFMYANAYSLSKINNYELYVDNESAYFKKKDFREFQLNNFEISAKICSDKLKFNTYLKNFYRKYLIQLDKIKKNKTFLIEKRNINKYTEYYNFFADFKYESISKGELLDLSKALLTYLSKSFFSLIISMAFPPRT